MLNSQSFWGLLVGSSVEYAQLEFGTESMTGIPGCLPFCSAAGGVKRGRRKATQQIPDGCLIAVCLRLKAVVGVYNYECRSEPP